MPDPRSPLSTAASRFLRLGLLAAFVALPSISFGAKAVSYSFTDLGTFSVQGLNNVGQLAGAVVSADGSTRAALWSAGRITELTTSTAGASSFAIDVNDRGEAIGSIGGSATYWGRRGAVTDYGTNSQFADINNRGQIAGSTSNRRAAVWSGSTVTQMPVFGGELSYAHSINDKGQVVGWGEVHGVGRHAMVWDGTGAIATDLSESFGPTGVASEAYDINDKGVMGGYTQFGMRIEPTQQIETHMRASVWSDDGEMTLLGRFEDTYVGLPHSYEEFFVSVLSINDKGQAVGAYGRQGATLFYRGVATNLNDFLDDSTLAEGWRISTATDINDKGWITGTAVNRLLGESHSYLLSVLSGVAAVTAVPEPSTWLMVLSGLFGVGSVARRRRHDLASAR